uniref:G-protein coupled receptors family 1 profile domain-containing protein n=1 Tax=Lates calcarifer TaxID=8187 RepID=A0A4W6G4R0_LATCA
VGHSSVEFVFSLLSSQSPEREISLVFKLFLCNSVFIVDVLNFRQLHTTTNLLLLSLAVADFLVGFLQMPVLLLHNQGCWILGDLICAVHYFLGFLFVSVSVGNIVLISVDRYIAICDPMFYTTKLTLEKVQLCICLCWIFSAVLLVKENLEQPGRYISCSGECVVVSNYIAGLADLVLTFIGPVIVIIVLYMRVFVVAVSQARAMRSHIVAVTLQGSMTVTVQKSELKAARALGVVVAAFLICLCPYFFVTLTAQESLLSASAAAFVICLFYFNSCLNPLIYAFFYPWFKKCLKLIVTLQILQRDSCEANIL